MVQRAENESANGRGPEDRGIEFRAFFKHMEHSEALEDYAERKLTATAATYLRRGGQIQVTFSVEGNRHDVHLHLSGSVDVALRSEAREGESMYACVDRIQDKLDETLRRRKEKWTQHQSETPWEELERLEKSNMKASAASNETSSAQDAVDAAYIIDYERSRAQSRG